MACLRTSFEKGDYSFIGEEFALFFGYLPLIFQIAFVSWNGKVSLSDGFEEKT